jgi:hypothetical protein
VGVGAGPVADPVKVDLARRLGVRDGQIHVAQLAVDAVGLAVFRYAVDAAEAVLDLALVVEADGQADEAAGDEVWEEVLGEVLEELGAGEHDLAEEGLVRCLVLAGLFLAGLLLTALARCFLVRPIFGRRTRRVRVVLPPWSATPIVVRAGLTFREPSKKPCLSPTYPLCPLLLALALPLELVELQRLGLGLAGGGDLAGGAARAGVCHLGDGEAVLDLLHFLGPILQYAFPFNLRHGHNPITR